MFPGCLNLLEPCPVEAVTDSKIALPMKTVAAMSPKPMKRDFFMVPPSFYIQAIFDGRILMGTHQKKTWTFELYNPKIGQILLGLQNLRKSMSTSQGAACSRPLRS